MVIIEMKSVSIIMVILLMITMVMILTKPCPTKSAATTALGVAAALLLPSSGNVTALGGPFLRLGLVESARVQSRTPSHFLKPTSAYKNPRALLLWALIAVRWDQTCF